MILFGWGHQTTKNYGATYPIKCTNCNNDVFWQLVHTRVWFTLFFIPVIPYKSSYYLLCEVCSQGVELKSYQVDKAKKLNQTTLSFLNKEIPEEQYNTALDEARLLE